MVPSLLVVSLFVAGLGVLGGSFLSMAWYVAQKSVKKRGGEGRGCQGTRTR